MSDEHNRDEPDAKRRRRTGWDIQAPASGLDTDQYVQQQAQQALIAQQLALQKAQQIIAQAAIQKSLQTTIGGIAAQFTNKPGCRIYIGSIHYDLREADIIALFATFGKITKSEMAIDPATQRSKGFCFIEFEDPASAEACMVMNGFELAGRKIKVGRPNQGASAAGAAVAPVPPTLMVPPPPTLTVPVVAAAQLTAEDLKVSCVLVTNMDKSVPLSEVETIFTAFGALLLCKVLPNTASTNTEVQSVVVEYADAAIAATTATSMNGFELAGLPLKCEVIARLRCQQLLRDAESSYLTVLLENMVTLEDTKDPDLKDEISDEARNFGSLRNVELLIDRAQVKVKLTYGDNASAVKALRAMHGRVFAGNKISAVLAP